MNYILKSGILYQEPDSPQAAIKSAVVGQGKRIFINNGTLALRTEIQQLDAPGQILGDVRSRKYVMVDPEGKTIAAATPEYAPGDNPSVTGWPVCRMPLVDRAEIQILGCPYMLIMLNHQSYALKDRDGHCIVQIMHRGLTGGWNIAADEHFTVEILCGIFAFCRYIERENELLIV